MSLDSAPLAWFAFAHDRLDLRLANACQLTLTLLNPFWRVLGGSR